MAKEGEQPFAQINHTGVEITPKGIRNEYTLHGYDPLLLAVGDMILRSEGAVPGESTMSKVTQKATTAMPGIKGWGVSWEPTGPQNAPHKEEKKGKLTPPPDSRWN